jgi:hypothetical protein
MVARLAYNCGVRGRETRAQLSFVLDHQMFAELSATEIASYKVFLLL